VRFTAILSRPLNMKHYTGFLFVLGSFLWIGINLRAPITSVAPILQQIRSDLNISASTAALLTSIPVLCFGVMTPLASALIRFLGIDKAVFASLLAVAFGSLLRSCGGTPLMLGGTVIIGAALTVGNIVCLMIIARDFYSHIHLVTGLYVIAMSIGSMSTSAFTAPLSLLVGWRTAIAVWTILPLIATLLWAIVVLRQKSANKIAPAKETATNTGNVIHNPLVWLLTLAFIAHLVLFYSLTAWLPTYYMQTQGMSETAAGYVESAYQSTAFIGAFGVPLLASFKRISNSCILLSVSVIWFLTPLGFYYFPELWPAWVVISGFSQGGGFSIIFSILMGAAKDLNENRSMSSFVQGAGYTLAAGGPLFIGYLHESFASWRFPMLFLSAFTLLMFFSAFGVIALERRR